MPSTAENTHPGSKPRVISFTSMLHSLKGVRLTSHDLTDDPLFGLSAYTTVFAGCPTRMVCYVCYCYPSVAAPDEERLT